MLWAEVGKIGSLLDLYFEICCLFFAMLFPFHYFSTFNAGLALESLLSSY